MRKKWHSVRWAVTVSSARSTTRSSTVIVFSRNVPTVTALFRQKTKPLVNLMCISVLDFLGIPRIHTKFGSMYSTIVVIFVKVKWPDRHGPDLNEMKDFRYNNVKVRGCIRWMTWNLVDDLDSWSSCAQTLICSRRALTLVLLKVKSSRKCSH